ncbi:hypothetical protein MLD38_011236 [Melastoma candidum]|uniref:Uncharacterized protein n=1 Tax=Melastoma candidum TaxID=119954 RepID=A0ACB9R3J0_9MYRT|nr:hypothetical protein MLD38_011236 [Melastoma candidum]
MDVSVCPLKFLPRDPNEDLHGIIRDQCDPLLKHEEEEEEEKAEGGVSEVGLIRSGLCLRVNFAERRRKYDAMARLDFSEDQATFTSGGYQPITDIWDMDSEEEHLISQHVQQRSNSKVRSIIEACRRMLGFAL